MKRFVVFITLVSVILGCSKNGPYIESADARADIKLALAESKNSRLPLIIIFGANWCSECRALDKALSVEKGSKKITTEFKLIKVNIGNFDTNLDVANDYGNPISGGIPGAALLSPDGNLVYTTKPGELSSVRKNGAEGLYFLFKNHFS